MIARVGCVGSAFTAGFSCSRVFSRLFEFLLLVGSFSGCYGSPDRFRWMSNEIEDKDTKKGGNDAAGPAEENLPLSEVQWLDLSREFIEAKHKKHMARALESGELKNLKTLCLHNNAGDLGVRALLNVLQDRGLPNLEKLILWNVSSYDQITAAEEGTDTIANAIAKNKMPKLHTLDITGSLPKLISPRPWMTVFRDFAMGSLGEGRLRKLKKVLVGCCTCTSDPPGKGPSPLECCCHMCGNYVYSGDDGVRKIVKALRMSRPPLKVLNLRDNHIGDKGVRDLAQLLSEGVLPLLEEVDLQNNPVSEVGEKRIVLAYLENPLLTASVMLDWSDQILKERASAFREKNLRLEHRLKDPELVGINMEQGKISTRYKWNPDYSIRRPSKKEPHRFRMRCQIEPHNHVTCAMKGAGARGIPIKENPLFSMPRCCSTPSRKLVYREYEEVAETLSTVVLEGKARISVTPGTCCFITAAKYQKRKEEQTGFWDRWVRFPFIKWLPFIKLEKTERQIGAIRMELLMFADRKPREFQEMFGLTRVLLEDPQAGGSHYPAYICEFCRVQLEEAGKSSQTVVKQRFLKLSTPSQQQSTASAAQPV